MILFKRLLRLGVPVEPLPFYASPLSEEPEGIMALSYRSRINSHQGDYIELAGPISTITAGNISGYDGLQNNTIQIPLEESVTLDFGGILKKFFVLNGSPECYSLRTIIEVAGLVDLDRCCQSYPWTGILSQREY